MNGQKTTTEKIKDNLLLILAAAAFCALLLSVGDQTGWRPIIKKEFDPIVGEMTQAQRESRRVALNVLLLKRRTAGPWTFDEQQEACRYARELQYDGIPGCTVRGKWVPGMPD